MKTAEEMKTLMRDKLKGLNNTELEFRSDINKNKLWRFAHGGDLSFTDGYTLYKYLVENMGLEK